MNLRSAAIRLLRRTNLLEPALQARNRIRRSVERHRTTTAPRPSTVQRAVLESEPALTIVQFRGRSVIARRRWSRTVREIMVGNRAIAIQAAEVAGIRYSAMPVDTNNRYRIAISEDDRDAFWEALKAHARVSAHVYFDRGAIPANRRTIRIDEAPATLTGEFGERATSARVWRLFEYFADASAVAGDLHGCEIEFWRPAADGASLRAARWNRHVDRVAIADFGAAETEIDGSVVAHTPATFERRDLTDVPFQVDVVYTWVDGSDPDWRARRDATLSRLAPTGHNEEAANEARFASKDELRYSLRSIEQYADFVGHIYIVTDGQRPDWLARNHPRVTVVDHRDIIAEAHLPTFNSHSIEANLFRIDGLSEHYLYLNDDFFVVRRLRANAFFHANGIAKFFLSRAHIPLGEPTSETKPVNAAAMNGRRLLHEKFGLLATRKFKHAPYPQLKSVQQEIWTMWADEVERTSSNVVRSPDDLALASSLHHYAAFALGRALPASIESRYVDLGSANLESRLYRIRRDPNFDVLCLNDNESVDLHPHEQYELVTEFMRHMFPVKSSFEI